MPAEQTIKILTQAALDSINKIAGNLISHSINFQWTVPDIAAEDPEDYNIFNTVIPGDRNFSHHSNYNSKLNGIFKAFSSIFILMQELAKFRKLF